MHTVLSVKRDLPDVPVQIGKRIVQAKLSGRLNDHASVTVFNDGTLRRGAPIWMAWHYAWQTIVNCLNDGRPLKANPEDGIWIS